MIDTETVPTIDALRRLRAKVRDAEAWLQQHAGGAVGEVEQWPSLARSIYTKSCDSFVDAMLDEP